LQDPYATPVHTANLPVSEEIVIRRERPDQPDVVALLGALDRYLDALYPPEANHILAVEALLAPDVAFFVARAGGRAVGTAALRRRPGEAATSGERYGEVKRMFVAPEARGRGVGMRLLEALERHLRSEGLELALLETGRDQHEAMRLYERAGYRARAAFGGYPDNGLSMFLERRVAHHAEAPA
jgi:putative acetyltransferase